MPTQAQFDTSLQSVRDIDCKIVVLDYDYVVLDEISGKTTQVSINVDAESDVRRTANVSMLLKDDAYRTSSSRFYWTVGNPYWFDKYIQIYVAIKDIKTQDFVWVNEGIYLINSPTIVYSAEDNSLSFQAIDLASKLTGLRNGQLQGMTYTVAVGSTITGAVEGILLEQGFTRYLIYEPPYNLTPQDINIDAGGTAWDLLCQLRDINSNWEMFFDVDGVFHFQQIPSGKVVVDPTTGEQGEPKPLVDNTVWDKLNIEYSLDTSFEDVKNYIEVLGKVHEADEVATCSISGSVANLVLSQANTYYLDNEWIVSFGVTTGDSSEYIYLANPITLLRLYDKNGQLIDNISLSSQPIMVGNEYYCFKMSWGENVSVHTFEYYGFLQPKAIAMEDNPDSPFYVGTSIEYTCATMEDVDFVSERELVFAEAEAKTSLNTAILNLSPWLTSGIYSSADVGTEWKFRVYIQRVPAYPVTKLNIKAGGLNPTLYDVVGANGQDISLDYSQNYMVVLKKTVSAFTVQVWYYPIPASEIGMSTTNMANLPKFDRQVRHVCSGDEYDNIYTNALAEQRARYEVYLRSRLHDRIAITSVPIYWLDVHQIIEYTLPNNQTEEPDLWLIKSIDTEISPTGTQTIQAMRYYPLYADITLENLATQD